MAHCILFIDDKPHIRQQVAALLEAHGYEVVLAANAPQAYSLLNQTAVEAALLVSTSVLPDIE